MSILLHDWSTIEELFSNFEGYMFQGKPEYPITDKEDIEILLASYTYECYSGSAFVLFRRISDGKLYEANGSHCSCYGLEGQWSPEEVTLQDLRHRLVAGRLGRDYDDRNEFAEELTDLLNRLEGAGTSDDNTPN